MVSAQQIATGLARMLYVATTRPTCLGLAPRSAREWAGHDRLGRGTDDGPVASVQTLAVCWRAVQ